MKVYARAIFDRKRQLETKGLGQVEILVTLNRYEKKYISVKKCTASEWQRYQYSVELEQELSVYNSIAAKMEVQGLGMTVQVFTNLAGIDQKKNEDKNDNIQKPNRCKQ